jgi:hypothetical protein
MNHSMERTVAKIRQLLLPREFRIEVPAWPPELAERLAKAIEAESQAAMEVARAEAEAAKSKTEEQLRSSHGGPSPRVDLSERMGFLADVGTGLWRMRRNMVPVGTTRLMEARPMEEVRKPFRWLVSVWDSLKENGLEIQDHTGERYLSGQAIKVQAYEPAPGIKEETVIDTIKPSIYLDGRMIQMGEVVVGTPDGAEAQPPQPKPPAPANDPKAPAPGKSYFAT